MVGGGVPRRSQTPLLDRVALLAQGRLAQASPVELDHVRPERLAAETGVRLGVVAAQLVVHVHRGHPVAERTERVPEARRVGAARDEAADLAPRLDQVVPADVLFDPRAQRCSVHAADCALPAVATTRRERIGPAPRTRRAGSFRVARHSSSLAWSTTAPATRRETHERSSAMHASKLPKLVLATALTVAALGATPLAHAGIGVPQKHPDGLGIPQKHPDGRAKLASIIAI